MGQKRRLVASPLHLTLNGNEEYKKLLIMLIYNVRKYAVEDKLDYIIIIDPGETLAHPCCFLKVEQNVDVNSMNASHTSQL